MALLQVETLDAFRAAGAPEAEARAAATAAADIDVRHSVMAERLDGLRIHLTIIQWVLGIGFAAVVALNILQANWMWQVLQRLPR